MTQRVLLFLSLCLVVKTELVFKKECGTGDVSTSTCRVTNVDVENCSHAPRFCRVGHGKRYPIIVSFVPNFTAQNMILNTMVELYQDGAYYPMRTTKRVCDDHQLVCPLEPHVKQDLHFDFHMSENLTGAYPVVVHLFNADNQTESCCFTFKIKSMSVDHNQP